MTVQFVLKYIADCVASPQLGVILLYKRFSKIITEKILKQRKCRIVSTYCRADLSLMISHMGTLHGDFNPFEHKYKACSAKTRKSCLHIWQLSPLLNFKHFVQWTMTIFIFLHLTSSQAFPAIGLQELACNQISMKARVPIWTLVSSSPTLLGGWFPLTNTKVSTISLGVSAFFATGFFNRIFFGLTIPLFLRGMSVDFSRLIHIFQ